MYRIDRVLLPLDLSFRSSVALRYAAFVAERHHASIDLLHVAEDPFGDEERRAGSAMDDLRQRAAQLRLLIEQVPPSEAYIGTLMLRLGDPVSVIAQVAPAGYDLLILGGKGSVAAALQTLFADSNRPMLDELPDFLGAARLGLASAPGRIRAKPLPGH